MSETNGEYELEEPCVFCAIVAGTVPSMKVAEDEATLAFMTTDPGSDGHLLVIPKRHSVDLQSIPTDDLVASTLVAQRIAKVMRAQLGAEGVNLLNSCGAAAWQTIPHFHWHVIPRYHDKTRDRLKMPFPPGSSSSLDAIARYAGGLAAGL
ncbi:HIT family protein [Microbacterium sp.]|uniref:HIT family protein n=1 Tax=Microbacterium sp. TaxID=51671 RepID=UPI003F7205FD